MSRAWRWLVWIALMLILTGLRPQSTAAANSPQRAALQGTSLVMVSPTACPSSGCAPGQRMNLRFDFELTNYSPTISPNVKVCFYAPTSWAIVPETPDTVQGGETGTNYTLAANCAEDTFQPTGYSLITAREAAISTAAISDSVPLVFRFSAAGTGNGRVVARLFERTETTPFNRTQQSTTRDSLSITALSETVYVANDAAACAANSPCFVNSADDLANGLGTGLRDAVEAITAGASINILGSYSVKSNTVVIDKPLTISGSNDAVITSADSTVCSQPLLSLRNAVTLRSLNINDGSCTSPGRSLVEINSSQPVSIETNDLVNGDNAIVVKDNSGAVNVLFNRINGNTGYALFAEGNSLGAALDVTANNLNGNRSGVAVECSSTASAAVANRRANHNYWGGSSPSAANSHCNLTAAKRMGAPIALNSAAPGVDAQLVAVGASKTYAFSNQIAYQRSGGSDFNLFIVNHGDTLANGVPFTTAAGGDSPSPCSNMWDVFLPNGVSPSGTLRLSFKYDKTSACLAAINSNKYCGQTTAPQDYPLYWYDPGGITEWWDTTGGKPANLANSEGQSTTCNTDNSEIEVAIDSSGRPNLSADLNFTPFMVGVPVLRTFLPLASNKVITVTWTTNSEPDISGFYVLRSLDGENFTPISDLIARRGSALVGVTAPYTFVDSGRTNGVTYYYRLQVVRADGQSFYSSVYSLEANVATITPTPTITPTRTRTPILPTNTLPATRIPTQLPTAVPTRTMTVRILPTTLTPYVFGTPTPFGFLTEQAYPMGTLDETVEAQMTAGTFYPIEISQSPGADLSETPKPGGTAVAAVSSGTPSPTPSMTIFPPTAAVETAKPGAWISLLLGLLAGLAVTASAGWWWFSRVKS